MTPDQTHIENAQREIAAVLQRLENAIGRSVESVDIVEFKYQTLTMAYPAVLNSSVEIRMTPPARKAGEGWAA